MTQPNVYWTLRRHSRPSLACTAIVPKVDNSARRRSTGSSRSSRTRQWQGVDCRRSPSHLFGIWLKAGKPASLRFPEQRLHHGKANAGFGADRARSQLPAFYRETRGQRCAVHCGGSGRLQPSAAHALQGLSLGQAADRDGVLRRDAREILRLAAWILANYGDYRPDAGGIFCRSRCVGSGNQAAKGVRYAQNLLLARRARSRISSTFGCKLNITRRDNV